jgi:glutamine amidotransferase-like uncharacterized protein
MENRTGFLAVLRIFGFATVLASSLFTSFPAQAGRPLALVYKGPGSCKDSHGNCAEAAAAVAERAGFDIEFVGPNENDKTLFGEASIYIQPGGNSTHVAEAMTAKMKKMIVDFVHSGGGYVGFCAGGFYAMMPYDDEGTNRLGLLDGDADVADFDYPSIQSVSWLDGVRHHVYWEGGAYFKLARGSDAEVVSRYSATRQAAAVRGMSGNGRVFVTGFHPEAPYDWRFDPDLTDADGTDADLELAVEMIRWAAHAPSRK